MDWITDSVEFLIYCASYKLYWVPTLSPELYNIWNPRQLAKYRVAVNFVVQTSEYHPEETPIPNLNKMEWN